MDGMSTTTESKKRWKSSRYAIPLGLMPDDLPPPVVAHSGDAMWELKDEHGRSVGVITAAIKDLGHAHGVQIVGWVNKERSRHCPGIDAVIAVARSQGRIVGELE